MSYRRTTMDIHRMIRSAPQFHATGPECLTCLCEVDGERLESEPGHEDLQGKVIKAAPSEFCDVVVSHHGAEERMRFDMGSVWWGPTELAKWVRRHRWFDPLSGHHGK